ncbi:MAG: hypothetical protein AB7G23_11445 [Vicinamibacterales bacterium]
MQHTTTHTGRLAVMAGPVMSAGYPRTTVGNGPLLTGWLRELWQADRVLTGAGLLMLALLIPTAAGLWLDPRLVTGAPAWLKPAKFAASTGVFMLTLAWVFTWLPGWPRLRRVASWTTAVVLVVEVAIIGLQAARGTASHFNMATPFDGVLFGIMGTGIALQTLASVAVAVALWRQAFADRALGLAIRLGMTLTIAGAAVGGLMTQPTDAQLAEAAVSGRMTVAGAHTVGAPDGGPGLPVTGWSTRAGDLRVPHFVGLHALQVLPLLALLVRRRPPHIRQRLVALGAVAYTVVFILLLAQALAGRPLVLLS